jgi:thioesterase-3
MKTQTMTKARGYHADMFGHVNHARFVELLEEGRWCYMEENGLPDLFHAADPGHVVTGIAVNYRRVARLGETMRIETGVKERGRPGFTMRRTIYLEPGGVKVLEAEIVNVFVETRSGRATVPKDDFVSRWSDPAPADKREETDE